MRGEGWKARRDALAWARSIIPLFEARLFLEKVLGLSRVALMAHDELPLSESEREAFETLVVRRAAGEPVAYLLGQREFYGRTYRVTPDVLIPRPETELLVELALERADAGSRVLDLGTGSGAVAVSLALEKPDAEVTAVDLSPAALAVARSNAQALGARVGFLQGSWYGPVPLPARFDLIVSNPPYVAPGDPHLAEGDLRFEPSSALVGQDDGLGDIRFIVHGAANRLAPGGWLLFEHGYDQGRACRDLLTAAGFTEVQTWPDLAGMDRVSGGACGQPPLTRKS
ncbi:MAG: peptide chain release factor N(5)-glutamine methyltransferase [Rhodocyclaceae bacterium]|nr:peptide chain release factor N(5)-glutamine methyltransferase [Rhodocyclaceae bacterium]